MATTYLKPVGQWIGRGEDTEKLYQLEEKRNKYIKLAAEELGKVLCHSGKDYWYKTMPEALLSILENFDTQASTMAAEAYLDKQALKKQEGR
jgi:sulfate adenylyltransferase subunit 1 (EFTu-like GTPase family)